MISVVGAVCRETRKAIFSRQEWTYTVHDWRKKCRLTQYHGKLTHYLLISSACEGVIRVAMVIRI